METKMHVRVLCCILVFISAFLILSGDAFAASGNRCLKCHTDIEKHKNVHPAIKNGCDICHIELNGLEHPVQKESIRLSEKVPGLCYKCHNESKYNKKFKHSPYAKGECTKCHNTHASDFNKLLRSDAPDICYTCHKKEKFTKKYVHAIIVNGCSKRCHSPHASDSQYCLAMPINEGCIGCHREQESGRHIASVPGPFIHPISGVPDPKKPDQELTCASCHNPHSSKYPILLYTKGKCRKCHKY
jgi:predicted CXXCH cytochrome family protein